MFRLAIVAACLFSLCACRRGEADGGTADPAAPAPAASAPSGFPAALDLTGTEPFWAVRIRPDAIKVMRPDHADLSGANPGVRMEGKRGVWDSSAGAQGLPFKVAAEPQTCSDGMSDTVYPYAASLELDGQVMSGCARPSAGDG